MDQMFNNIPNQDGVVYYNCNSNDLMNTKYNFSSSYNLNDDSFFIKVGYNDTSEYDSYFNISIADMENIIKGLSDILEYRKLLFNSIDVSKTIISDFKNYINEGKVEDISITVDKWHTDNENDPLYNVADLSVVLTINTDEGKSKLEAKLLSEDIRFSKGKVYNILGDLDDMYDKGLIKSYSTLNSDILHQRELYRAIISDTPATPLTIDNIKDILDKIQ